MSILIIVLALDAQGLGGLTGYEDHEALLTKTLSIKRSLQAFLLSELAWLEEQQEVLVLVLVIST